MNHKDASTRNKSFPYIIAYVKGARRLADSATSLESAHIRIARRLAKRHNRDEKAEIFLHGNLIETISI